MSSSARRSVSPARRALLVAAVAAGALAAGLPAAAQASTAAPAGPPAPITGGAVIAYHGDSDLLTTVTPDGVVHSSEIGEYYRTSPGIAAGPDGAYYAVANGGDGSLWALNAKGVIQRQHVSVVPSTSPAVSYYGPRGSYQTYFQSAPGQLGNLSGFGGQDLIAKDDYTVDPEINPSTSEGAVEITNRGEITSVNGAPGAAATLLQDAAPGTSPSVGYFPGPDGTSKEVVAWEQTDFPYDLSYETFTTSGGTTKTQEFLTDQSMTWDSSPAVAVQPDGSYEVAFQSSHGTLGIVGSSGQAHDTGLRLAIATSPAITALPGGGFEVAFQANTGALWTVDGTTFAGQAVPGTMMSPQTSPSISAYVPTYASKSAPSPTPGQRPTPKPASVSQYTVANCSYIDPFSEEGFARGIQLWLRDDSVPGAKFTQVADLEGRMLSGLPCRSNNPPQSWSLSPKAGHAYEIRVNGDSFNGLSCAATATACPLYWTKVSGKQSASPLALVVDVR